MEHNAKVAQSIVEYINLHFKDATIEQWEHEKKESINFNIIENDRTYILRVMNECIQNIEAEEVILMLENYNVAQVLRDIGDFPIVVTNSGCIFGSP